jgi:hypothetical protein
MDQQTPTRLIGIYNADGGIVGELKYFFSRFNFDNLEKLA